MTIADLPEDPHESPFGEEPETLDPRGGRAARCSPSDEAGATSRRSGRRRTASTSRCASSARRRERQYIVDTLRMTGWNISRTAILLGVERTNLHKKIRAYRHQARRGLKCRARMSACYAHADGGRS